MKRIIQPIIASVLAASFICIPVFSEPLPPNKPTEAGTSVPTHQQLKLVKPIAELTAAPLPEIQPVPVPEPAPAPTPAPTDSGCVTGYVSGDYYLDKVVAFESGGRSCATNPGGCFGLLQACPGAPLRAACGGEPACQIAWFQANKTGGRSWAEVWQHELDYGWW
jgi:hypothetical protein